MEQKWNKSQRIWKNQKIGDSIGRIYNIHPSSFDLYYLRMVVRYVNGSKNSENILKVHGKIDCSFKDVYVAKGLLEGDEECHEAMKESSLWVTPNQLRNLCFMLLVHCKVKNPLKLRLENYMIVQFPICIP